MAKEIQFMRAGQYKAVGITHLKHVLREKYDQNRIPVSDIRLWKWENGSFVEASKQELHELYEYNMQHRQRKNANVFWEYMLSGYDSEKTAEVAKYLCNFFDNRTVFAIEHRDEGHYHTHFIIFVRILLTKKARIFQKESYIEYAGIWAKLRVRRSRKGAQVSRNMWVQAQMCLIKQQR